MSDPAVLTFIILPLVVAAAFVCAVAIAWRRSGASVGDARRAAMLAACGTAAWMAATDIAARSGVLRQWDWTPPPFLALPLSIPVLGVALAFGPIGRRFAAHLPLWWLIASQSFRLPLELAMHVLSERGIMPVQMSYSGRNLDIVTGATAVHICFGYAAIIHDRPAGYSFLPELAACSADQISIETAQSGLDLGVLKDLSEKDIILGVIDLSDHEVESADVVADRVRRAFPYASPDRITIATDCGMKYLPRASAEGKMRAMAGAASILRAEL